MTETGAPDMSDTTTPPRSAARRKPSSSTPTPSPAPGYRLRVRMYRHGLGDCFLLSFPRAGSTPLQMLIDCGALARDKLKMTELVTGIRDTLRAEGGGKARLDVVVGTHEHQDHVSGFNQARPVFNDDIDIGSVWLAWTEDLDQQAQQQIRQAKAKTVDRLAGMVDKARAQPGLAGSAASLGAVEDLLGFSRTDDSTGAGRVADAMAYLKQRGKAAGDLRFLSPGGAPFALPGHDGVRVYVLGPPKDPGWLKTSAITGRMKDGNVVYNLAARGDSGLQALEAALDSQAGLAGDTGHPFAPVHRFRFHEPAAASTAATAAASAAAAPSNSAPKAPDAAIRQFLTATYDDPAQAWRRIDGDWLASLEQLALDLDNDTNNTSLVLAFEFVADGRVLLFPADAQIGSWLSWADLDFKLPGQAQAVKVDALLNRTVFYKVGHHCSHNATAKLGGLEQMTQADLVAFIPLDKATAASRGSKEAGGWDMPAPALFKALQRKTGQRLVISDVNEVPPPQALAAGISATPLFIDYFLR